MRFDIIARVINPQNTRHSSSAKLALKLAASYILTTIFG